MYLYQYVFYVKIKEEKILLFSRMFFMICFGQKKIIKGHIFRDPYKRRKFEFLTVSFVPPSWPSWPSSWQVILPKRCVSSHEKTTINISNSSPLRTNYIESIWGMKSEPSEAYIWDFKGRIKGEIKGNIPLRKRNYTLVKRQAIWGTILLWSVRFWGSLFL